GEISPGVQVKLLKMLQERKFEQVNSQQTLTTDVRVIATTNRNLKEMVARGTFREDLFYRLNVMNLHMPSLHKRRSDIGALTKHFIKKYSQENGKSRIRLSPNALALLTNYAW